jgi:hypothetical protein
MPFDINSKLKDIGANDAAKAIFEKYVPGFFADPRSKQAYGMSLKVVCSFPQSKPIKEKLDQILAEFAKLP